MEVHRRSRHSVKYSERQAVLVGIMEIIQDLMKNPSQTNGHTYKTIFQDFCESGKKFEEIYPDYLIYHTDPDDKKQTELLNKVAGLYLSEKRRGGKLKDENKKCANPFIQIWDQNKYTNPKMMYQLFVNKENIN